MADIKRTYFSINCFESDWSARRLGSEAKNVWEVPWRKLDQITRSYLK
jgi:hypothetical protein